MRTTWWLVGATAALAACMPTDGPTAGLDTTPHQPVPTELPVRLSEAEVAEAAEAAGCTSVGGLAEPTANHVGEDAPPAAELYEQRPATAGDHLGAWVEVGRYDEAPDERAVVHNHEHGAVSVWHDPDVITDDERRTLFDWEEARNPRLGNDAGAGIVVAPFEEGLPDGAAVAFRAWTGGLDCERFDVVVADGFLLERFGDAPEGSLAPPLAGVVERSTAV